jgi:hypothetical protein
VSALDSLFGSNQTQQDRGRSGKGYKAVVDVGYPEKKHAYAIRMLAELEDAQKEVSNVGIQGCCEDEADDDSMMSGGPRMA